MTVTTKARHRKAARPTTPLTGAAPAARRGLAVAATSGLALTMAASGAAVANDSAATVGESAGSLEAGVNALAAQAREAVTTNEAVAVSADAAWQGSAAVEAAVEAAPTAEPAAAEPAAAVTKAAVPASAAGSSVVAIAYQYVGSPYVYGAEGPSAFDCSGLVKYVYGQVGVSLPHQSEAIRRAGTVVPASEAQPGDVIWWSGHVAIYAGNGMMVSANDEGTGVVYTGVWNSPTFIRIG